MTFVSERKFDGTQGGLAGVKGEAGWMDVFWAARRQSLDIDNAFARTNMMEAAYDDRIEAVYKATGQRLTNPFRGGVTPEDVRAAQEQPQAWQGSLSQGAWISAAEDRFSRNLTDLAERYPEHVGVIRADRSPREDARERARNTERALGDTLNRYHGAGSTLALLGGGFAGMLQDPVNAASALVGPWGGARSGLKGLLWMAVRQGAWNAATEAALQPNVALWRKEAGLGYDVGDFARNVGTAFVFGAGLDMTVRGGYRAIQSARGRVPRLAPDGTVQGYQTPDQALEEAALRTKSDTLRMARDGDAVALRRLANETGVDATPEGRALLDALDNHTLSDRRLPGMDAAEHEAGVLQVERHLANRAEPLPVMPEPLPEARGPSLADGVASDVPHGGAAIVDDRPVWREASDGAADGHVVEFERVDGARERLGDERRADAWVLREADGWTRAEAEAMAARKRLAEGDLEPVEAALLMREYPAALDASVSLAPLHMRQARALSRLDEAAFDRVISGDVDPSLAALVGDLVPDKMQHASMLRALDGYAPKNEADARQAIGVLARQGAREAAFERGLDDPFGSEGDLQIAQLERLLADEVAAAEGRPARQPDGEVLSPKDKLVRDLVAKSGEAAPDATLAQALGEATKLEQLAQLMGACKL